MRKPNKLYLLYRIYAIVVFLTGITINGWVLLHKHFYWLIVLLLPFVLPAFFLTLSLAAFRFNYSAFGCLQNTLPPNEPILEQARTTGGRIGWLSISGLLTWSVYPSGLGFSVPFVGKGFIPVSDISNMRKGVGMLAIYMIAHTNPEVRSPLIVRNTNIYQRLAQLFAAEQLPEGYIDHY
jgi:hypothetical protein